jgi:hypothetical protein
MEHQQQQKFDPKDFVGGAKNAAIVPKKLRTRERFVMDSQAMADLSRVFRVFDEEGTGKITFTEFIVAMKSLGWV